MTIIDTTTVSALLLVLAVALFATAITMGIVLRTYIAQRTWQPGPVRTPAGMFQGRYAH